MSEELKVQTENTEVSQRFVVAESYHHSSDWSGKGGCGCHLSPEPGAITWV